MPHALVCPSFTPGFMDDLTASLLPDHERTLVAYPGLAGTDGVFTLAGAEEAIAATADAPPRPRIGVGYSLGANLLLRQVALDRVQVDALVLLSPVASWKRRSEEAGRLFRRYWEDLGGKHGFDHNRVLKELRELPEAQEAVALAPRVDCPVLVLHGMRDVDVPMAHGQALAKAVPDGTFASVPTDHFWKGGVRPAAGRTGMFLAGLDL